MNNGKTIRDAIRAAKETPIKPDPYKYDVIEDPMGQWKHPGKITKIPSGDITMIGVPYPVFGVDNQGNSQMMFPGENYTFPGSSVTEFPMAQTGGWLDEFKRGGPVNPLMLSRSKRSTTKKNIQSSINKLLLRNKDVFGPGGKNVYDPKSKYKLGGGWLDNLD